ncbi:MAG TPA: hypothetical protein VEF04_07170 [Blastocatellia bacterium]|nr:hypothetical protein [Blastocatellia bacterium]
MRWLFVLCCITLITNFAAAQSTEVSKGCLFLDNKKSSLFMSLDEEWKEAKTVRLIIKNNTTCSVSFITTGRQSSIIKKDSQGFRVEQPKSNIIEDGGTITLEYKINSEKQPNIFTTYWPYGHVVFTHTLLSGRTAKFVVPIEHVKGKRQIAVVFFYDWEDSGPKSGIEHLVYSPYRLIAQKQKSKSR